MQYAVLVQVALAFFASVSNANYAYHTSTWPSISPPAPGRYNARNATLAPRGELAQRAITDKAVFIHHVRLIFLISLNVLTRLDGRMYVPTGSLILNAEFSLFTVT